MAGETVSHYEILERLGSGGMGVVYKALDRHLDRYVALKFLPAELSHDTVANDRFNREARSASALDHPNICTIYDIDHAEDGRLFIAMPYYPGETLAARIARGPLAAHDAVAIALQIARALARAHHAGIVHRDLKPANVMLTEHREVKILDFGLAKLVGAARPLTDPGARVGTVLYMSPEQARGAEVDERADLWSLGCVLYEMLAGRPPFRRDRPLDTLADILHRDPPPISEGAGKVPAEVERLVRQLLAKDPERRPRSAAEVATRLQRSTAFDPDPAEAETRESPWWRPDRSRAPRGWLYGALAAALAVATAAVWLWVSRPAVPAPIQNLVVLPFANLTGDAARGYLSDGLSSVLIQQLSSLPGLNVVGRSDAFAYKEKGKTSREIARELGVNAIVEGQLLATGSRLRVQANLTDAATGFVVWSTSVEGSPDDSLRMQDEVGRALIQALSRSPAGAALRGSAREPTRSRAAYDAFLRAVDMLDHVDNPRRVELATSLLRRTLELDPDFALAHAELAVALVEEPTAALLPEAEAEAKRALALVPDLPSGRLALAKVYRTAGRSADTIAELLRLIVQHPDSDLAYRELAFAYWDAKDPARAETSFRQAIAIRPDYWKHWHELGGFLLDAGDYPGCRDALEHAIRLAPADVTWPRQGLAVLDLQQGRYAEAIQVYEQLPRPITEPTVAANIGSAHFYLGQLDLAEPYYRLAVRLAPRGALFHRNLGDLLERKGDLGEAHEEFLVAERLQAERLATSPDERTRTLHILFLAKTGRCEEARRDADAHRDAASANGLYQLAASYAVCGERASALRLLRLALERGYSPANVPRDVEFSRYAGDPEFRGLIRAANHTAGSR